MRSARPLWGCLVVLIVCLSGLVRGKDYECPAPVFVQPCNCTRSTFPVTVKCTNQTDLTALKAIFDRSDRPFTAFVLDQSNLMYLPSGAITRKGIQQITIANSSLLALFDRPPDEGNEVSHLHVLNSTLQRTLQWEQLRSLKKLLDLTVERTEVRQVGKVFERSISASLQKFQLYDTDTKYLSPTAFQKLGDLKTIVVVKTRLTTLKRSMFPKENHLFVLDFSLNSIQTLPDDVFSDMPYIRDVYLTGNKLKIFSEAVFGHIMDTSVMIIDVQENPISCDCTFKWFLYKERYVGVGGICTTPVDKKGKKFRELRRKEFDNCP